MTCTEHQWLPAQPAPSQVLGEIIILSGPVMRHLIYPTFQYQVTLSTDKLHSGCLFCQAK